MEQQISSLNSINTSNNNIYSTNSTTSGSNINIASDGQNADGNNVNGDNNSISGNSNKNISRNSIQSASNNAEKGKELSKQIESNINPTPMLSQAMLFKWDASAGGAVINVVDFKTGKVLAQIPPKSVLKMMANYQKGSLYNSKL